MQSPHGASGDRKLQRENPIHDGTHGHVVHPHGAAWFALLLRSRHEFSTRDALVAQEIEQFLPTVEVTTRWTDRQVTTTRPLFPGYIFARFDPVNARELAAVYATRGVVSVLGTDGPEAIPDAVIANLQRIAATPNALSLCAYVAGETVTVSRGPFAGVTGVISRVKGATSLTIPVQILGRAVSVQIDAADIEP